LQKLKLNGIFCLMMPTLGSYRDDRDDEGWYEDFNVPPQLQWNLFRSTWEKHLQSEGNVELFSNDIPMKFGALKPDNFYFGRKISNK